MKTSMGFKILWSAEHRDKDGNLIVRQTVLEPKALECYRLSCLLKYPLSTLQYILACYYHKCRADYAEKHRHNTMPERYRTGEPSPETIWQALQEILKIKIRRN